jgi:hypothetical protein
MEEGFEVSSVDMIRNLEKRAQQDPLLAAHLDAAMWETAARNIKETMAGVIDDLRRKDVDVEKSAPDDPPRPPAVFE